MLARGGSRLPAFPAAGAAAAASAATTTTSAPGAAQGTGEGANMGTPSAVLWQLSGGRHPMVTRL